MRRTLFTAALVAAAVASACGDNTAANTAPDAATPNIDAPAPTPDATPPAPDAAPYPAIPVTMPQVTKGATGSPMATVRVVPVFLPGDPLHDQLLDFFAKLAASSTWTQMVAEYGVGAMTIGTPVELTTPAPMALDDTEIRWWLQQQLSSGLPEWGTVDAPTLATTVYVILYQEGTTIRAFNNQSCTYFLGYHGSAPATIADPTSRIIYSVIPRCTMAFTGMTEIDSSTNVLSHELVEAATDPYPGPPGSAAAWTFLPDADFAWQAFGGAELGDMCELTTSAAYVPADIGYTIQRTWSNASAAAGHDPCVPIPPGSEPFFGAIPDTPDQVAVVRNGTTIHADGVNIAVGQVRTIDLRLFSEGPTSGPWGIQLYDLSTPPAIDVILQNAVGQNGDVRSLVLHAAHPIASGYGLVMIRSVLGGRDTYWPLLVGVTP